MGGADGDATTVDLREWDRDMRINVTSMVLMCRYVVPKMRKNGRGAIVNLSSIAGRELPNPSDTSFLYMRRPCARAHADYGLFPQKCWAATQDSSMRLRKEPSSR